MKTLISVRLGSYAIDFLNKYSSMMNLTKSDIIRLCIYYAMNDEEKFFSYCKHVESIRGIYTDEGEFES